MTVQEEIKDQSLIKAHKLGLLDGEELDVTNYEMQMVKDYVKMVQDDVLEYHTIFQPTNDLNALFYPVYGYIYSKGVEATFYDRIGNEIERIDYNFLEMFRGSLALNLYAKVGSMDASGSIVEIQELYRHITSFLKGKNAQLIQEGTNYNEVMYTMLLNAFYLGRHKALTLELHNLDYSRSYECPEDEPCDFDEENSFRFLSI